MFELHKTEIREKLFELPKIQLKNVAQLFYLSKKKMLGCFGFLDTKTVMQLFELHRRKMKLQAVELAQTRNVGEMF